MTIDDALKTFREAAIAKGDFATPSDDRQYHRKMAKALHFLQVQGESGRTSLKRMLSDESSHIRVWVAAQILSEGDETGLPVLREIAQSSGLLAFDAKMTIQEYEAGLLQSPFPKDVA